MMIEYVLMITTVLGAVIALMQRDLLKAAILTGIPGISIAFLYQFLLAPDVALTQAIVGSAIVPVFFALAVLRTRRTEENIE
jgi:energy-converting hydrogenase B subunit D